MSWDIYGNTLRSGHCEVHPYVHESYPCSVCYSEQTSRSREQRDDRIQERPHEETELEYYKRELEKCHNRVEELESFLKELDDSYESLPFSSDQEKCKALLTKNWKDN